MQPLRKLEPFEQVKVRGHGISVRTRLTARCVLCQGLICCSLAHVHSQRSQQRQRRFRRTTFLDNVHIENRPNVLRSRFRRRFVRKPDVRRPPSSAAPTRHIGKPCFLAGRTEPFSAQKHRKRHPRFALARLAQCHRPHGKPSDPARSGMANLVAFASFERRGTGKQQHAALVSRVVNEPACRIPNLGNFLPLINKMGGIAHKRKRRFHLRRLALGRFVKLRHACASGPSRPGFPAPFRPVDFHTAKRFHKSIKATFDKPRLISLGYKFFPVRHGETFRPVNAIRYFTAFSFGKI